MPKDRLHLIIKPIMRDLKKVDAVIKRNMRDAQAPLGSMLRYSVSGGKRLRPALIVLTGRLFKFSGQRLHVLAAAVEVLHSATLIHDDLVDDSPLRRGRRTLNAIFPPGATVLAGDYLLARSVSLIAGLDDPRLLAILADTLHTMSKGEIAYHYSGESKEDRSVYYRSIEAKTAVLFAAAARMTGVLAGRSKRDLHALSVFGREFGIAYQIVDDVLDLTGAESRLGKPAGRDLAQGTITLPVICHLERHASDKTMRKILSGKGCMEDIRKAIRSIKESGAIDEALSEARAHAKKAKAVLSRMPAGRARQSLIDLTEYIVERKH